MLVGAVTGFGASALAKESLAAGAEKMRSLMIKGSSTFAGVVDSPRKVRNNQSGLSAGINVGGVTSWRDKLASQGWPWMGCAGLSMFGTAYDGAPEAFKT